MPTSERAGLPADPSSLVDLRKLVSAYYELRPDPSMPGAAGGVRDVRPSRLRLQHRLQRGPHRRHDRGDLPLPARPGDRRAAVHRARHARPVGAGVPERARGAGRPRGRRPRRRRRRLHADAGDLARDPHLQPRSPRAPGRRDRRHPVAQPARGRRLQVQPAQRRPGRHRRHRLDRRAGQRAAGDRRRDGQADPVRARARGRDRARLSWARTSATSTRSSTWRRSGRPGCASGSIRSAARASPTGRRSPNATAST